MPSQKDITSRFRPFTAMTKDWGPILLFRPLPIPGESEKGLLTLLDSTPLGPWVQPVSGEAITAAIRGHGTRLKRELKVDPARALGALQSLQCALKGKCAAYRTDTCFPGSRMPVCFDPGIPDPDTHQVAYLCLQAWHQGRHVIYVTGSESHFE